jgi:flagella basal body P-ring formation protein FlgA
MIVLLALAAAAFQDIPTLDHAVAGFTTRPVGSEGGARAPIDRRLRLAACPTVSISWRTDAHDAVVVSCAGPTTWRLFVPVLTPPRAAAAAPAAIAAAPKPTAPVIRRGDPITIEAGSDGFSISREGVAMGDAAPGARFQVRVQDSVRPVQAVAVEPGRATIPGWPE